MNVWGIDCSVKSSIKYIVNNTAESFKSGISKNDRKIDISFFYFWPFKKGLVVWGQSEETRVEVGLLFYI